MTSEPLSQRPAAGGETATRRRKPGISRARRVEELLRGNVRAWRHGIFAEVAVRPDVEIEVGLIFAARPSLDPLRDTRLVEQLAMVSLRCRRVHLLIDEQGPTQLLTSYDAKLSPLAERLERAVHEREQLRIRARDETSRSSDLARYRPAERPSS